jgi:hypothetical protein
MLYNNPDIHNLNFHDHVNLEFQHLMCQEFKFHWGLDLVVKKLGFIDVFNICTGFLHIYCFLFLFFFNQKIDASTIEDFYGLTSDIQKSSETGYILFYQSRDCVWERNCEIVLLNQLFGKTTCFMSFYSKCRLSEVNFSTSVFSHWTERYFSFLCEMVMNVSHRLLGKQKC